LGLGGRPPQFYQLAKGGGWTTLKSLGVGQPLSVNWPKPYIHIYIYIYIYLALGVALVTPSPTRGGSGHEAVWPPLVAHSPLAKMGVAGHHLWHFIASLEWKVFSSLGLGKFTSYWLIVDRLLLTLLNQWAVGETFFFFLGQIQFGRQNKFC
jgi:hypothetical protein